MACRSSLSASAPDEDIISFASQLELVDTSLGGAVDMDECSNE